MKKLFLAGGVFFGVLFFAKKAFAPTSPRGMVWGWPLAAGTFVITSPFGTRISPLTASIERHPGIDMAARAGTPVYAAADGVVTRSYMSASNPATGVLGYGNRVIISHPNEAGKVVTSTYNHMQSRAVAEGAAVSQGDVIGYVGTTGASTGNHLHFEIIFDGTPVDPTSILPPQRAANIA